MEINDIIPEETVLEKWPCVGQGKWSWEKSVCHSVYKDFLQGWWLSFVPEMLNEVDHILKTSNIYPYFFFGEVREKYGSLRVQFYFDDVPEEIISVENLQTVKDKLRSLFTEYTSKSYEVCAECGSSASVCTYPWEGYYCDTCKPKIDGRDIREYRVLENNAQHIRFGRNH